MKDVKKYFNTEEDYNTFMDGLSDMFEEITLNGRRKPETGQIPFKGGAAVVRALPYKSLPKEGYWVKVDKMSKITLD